MLRTWWRQIAIGFLVLLFVLLLTVYQSIFVRSQGYLYEPTTDALFDLQLVRDLGPDDWWSYLLTFTFGKPTDLWKVDDAEYLGRFGCMWANSVRAEKDWEAFSKEVFRDIQIGDSYLEIVSFAKNHWKGINRLPQNMQRLLANDGFADNDISYVTASACVKWFDDEVVKCVLIDEAVLIKGSAAFNLGEWSPAWFSTRRCKADRLPFLVR